MKTIKPLCKCEKCGADITPDKAEVGRYLIQFRTTPYDPARLREAGRKGGRPKKGTISVKI